MKILIDISEERFKDIQRISSVQLKDNYFKTAEQIIANGTPYDERPKGAWLYDYTNGFGNKIGHCSECIYRCEHYNFCPNCGASMEETYND